jgi:hypothetical protein
LSLKIKDIVFKHSEEKQYAEILVNGKTGPRVIPLFYSLPYVKDWILDHPQSTNRNAILICGLAKNLGRRLSRYAIYDIYQHYREKVFPTLLSDPNVSLDDKHKIRNLLNKPWNPYIISASNPWNTICNYWDKFVTSRIIFTKIKQVKLLKLAIWILVDITENT